MRTRKRRKLTDLPENNMSRQQRACNDCNFITEFHLLTRNIEKTNHYQKLTYAIKDIDQLSINKEDAERLTPAILAIHIQSARKLTRSYSNRSPLENFSTLFYYLIIFSTFLHFLTEPKGENPFKSIFGLSSRSNLLFQPVACDKLFNARYQLPVNVPQRNANLPELIVNQGGIIANKNVTLTQQHNPILITQDIIVKKDSKLTIEAGTELLFARKKGITVYGTLKLLGSSTDRVKLNLLKSPQSATINFRSHNNYPYVSQQVRLVDGDLPNEGRVQIKFNNRWHSLCTNSRNLTAADIKVICHQVGYQEGHWYRWFPKKNATTIPQIMSKSFMCTGSETAIAQCKRWNRVRSGGGVCDFHSDIGIRCSRALAFDSPEASSLSYEFWRGIEFINSEVTDEYILDGQMKQKASKSILRHVLISDAGLSESGNATAAILVRGQPPKMSNLEVKNSVYGIMIENTDDVIRLTDIRLHNNLGNPLFINTSWGKVTLDNMLIEENGGDGVRVVRHEKVLVGVHDFCKFANLGSSQSFPVVLSHEQTFFTSVSGCCQEFISNHQLTVHFTLLRSTPNNLLPDIDTYRKITIPPGVSIGNDAHLIIYDDYRDEFPFRLRISNGTRAQSVVSKSGRLKICYEPASFRTIFFTIEIVADYDEDGWTGIARDVEISNSFISSNEGRGIWIENQRSGVKLINTTVQNHDYVAGVHFENGTGEVIIQASTITNNTGHGVFINLGGGYFHIDNSTVSNNSLKGVAIQYDPRPELVAFNHTVHVGYSLIMGNGENGILLDNVCRSDAYWNISMNSFINNREDALLFKSCLPTQDNINSFRNLTTRLNLSDPTLLFHNNYQELQITHNTFLANRRRAIIMSPVFFVKSFIRHNMFREHPLAVIHIGNQELSAAPIDHQEIASSSPVYIRIASNRFYLNRGRYVASIGVQEDNPKHSLMFTRNTLVNNHVTNPYPDMKPRSMISAVVVVSSSNTRVIRNRFDNPLSSYELGSHVQIHSKVINATANYWGPDLDSSSIYKRIFDRKNRYNLAQVEFLQYLLSPEDLEYGTDFSFDKERDKITTFRNGSRIGGEVKGYEELSPGSYSVVDDIFVRPGAHLVLNPGTTFRFPDGIGMMVQGRLDAIGRASSNIVFTSSMSTNRMPSKTQQIASAPTQTPPTNQWISNQPDVTGNNLEHEGAESVIISENISMKTSRQSSTRRRRQVAGNSQLQNVRLSHITMGRLEVQIDGVYGSVCDYNFDIHDAAVVCQQLGMILNKDDWLLEKFQYAANDEQLISMMSNSALMTNVHCDPSLDSDITTCKAEISLRGDFDGMCNSEVGIRCFPPSWSGLRIGMGAETSTLEHVTIQKAGLFDYATYSLKPALQIDFNKHWLSFLNIKMNSDSGLGIMWNDVIGRHFSQLTVTDSKFHNNERHGIELRTKGLSIRSCSLSSNRQNGLDYSPSFSQKELNDLLSWLPTAKNSDNIVTMAFPLQESNKYFPVPSAEDSYKLFVFPQNPRIDLIENFTIGTDPGHMLSIQILNPIHPKSTEVLNMSIGTNYESPRWDLRVNLTSFPMISPGYRFHFNYSTGSRPIGNIVLYIRTRYNNRDLKTLSKYIPASLVMSKFEQTAININTKLLNSLTVSQSNITKNSIGLKLHHPNYSFNSQADYNLRYANETISIVNNLFDGNHFSCLFVSSDDFEVDSASNWQNQTTPASEIYYSIVGNIIRRNKDGIRHFSRVIQNSNNVYHWSINDTIFDQNKGGGIHIILPYYWAYDANLSHTIEISNNSFTKNTNFELDLDGHFAVLNLTRNNFRENRCKSKLIALSGMEKKMRIQSNMIENNICNRIVDFNILSHADKMGYVTAQFNYNSLRNNRKAFRNTTFSSATNSPSILKNPKWLSKLHSSSTDYTVSLRGVQVLNITRNLFVNPNLRFELVVAIIMDPNERTVNAIENYWGHVISSDIDDRILDFDDWNSYAIAEVNPFLTIESLSSATIIGGSKVSQTLNRPLGGRLFTSMTLPYRKEPYLVESDLTVMPGVRLTIEKGTVLEFMPNVGILVLGELIAAGTRDKQIQLRPFLNSLDVMPLQQQLFPSKARPNPLQNLNLNDPSSYDNSYALRHYQLGYPIDLGSIRLCKNEICNSGTHIYENNVENVNLREEVLRTSNNTWKMDGFLEIFNMTTLQWVPVCDPLFTEHSARVVCRELGYSHLSIVRRGKRYLIDQERIMSIRNWPESIQCDGDESSLSSCSLAHSEFANHTSACSKNGNQYVYIYCQDFPEAPNINHNHGSSNEHLHHWGGIRFSCPSLIVNQQTSQNLISDSFNSNIHKQVLVNGAGRAGGSRLQYVIVEKAGMLHRKKSPAIQVLQCPAQLEYVTVSNSAHHGIEIITSIANQNFHQLRIRNNLGIGFNYLSLTGSSSASRLVPYLPLKHLDISSNIFGLVDICGANKEIQIEDRLLLFYRYGSQPVDCVKIISSKLNIKHVGIRMLQFDLFNSTLYTTRPDSLLIYDGSIFDGDSRLLVDLGVTEKHRLEKPELKFYQTTDSAMTIRMHVSGASPLYGFIAELVSIPVSSFMIQRDSYNNITFSELTHNKLGALMFASAGESSPNFIMKNNRIESNCIHLFGNFTSCTSSLYMEVQNCQKLKIFNNLFRYNQGGITIKSYSHSAVSALDASIENNVIESNQNNNVLALLGPKSDPYQTVRVAHNFITRNVLPYLSDIVLSRMVANFSYNIISGNIGKHQIEVLGFDKLPMFHQSFQGNWIYNNTATLERDRSTISASSAGQYYLKNYLVNPDNHFEITTVNWSRYDVKPFHTPKDDEIIHLASGDGSSKDFFRKTVDAIPISVVDTKKNELYHATITAQHNWWGFNTTSAIQGRIRDRIQHEELIKVNFVPFLETNRSVLSDICAGGWHRVGDACLVYVGSRMTYQEAKDFCDRELATLPLLRGDHAEYTEFIKTQERDFDSRIDRVWIRSFDVFNDACPALNEYRTKNYDCLEKYSFMCEKDPQVIVSLLHWHKETGGLIALVLASVTVMLTVCCTVCWAYKSRQRHKEKKMRQNSIYASMRSNRAPYSSSNSLSELFLHRQIYNPTEKSSIVSDLSVSTQLTQPSDPYVNLASVYKTRSDPPLVTSAVVNARILSNQMPYSNKHQQQVSPTSNYQSSSVNNRLSPKGSNNIILESQQPSLNPDYVSPSPSKSFTTRHQHSPTIMKPPIVREEVATPPAPSYREVHPRALSSAGSKTPSYAGEDSFPEPMPVIVTPTYSRINHALTAATATTTTHGATDKTFNKLPPRYDSQYHYQKQQQVTPTIPPKAIPPISMLPSYNDEPLDQLKAVDGSNQSSVPTYYSSSSNSNQPINNYSDNQYLDTAQSYIATYNDAYNRTLQKINNDYTSYVLTERSSMSEYLIQSNNIILPAATKTSSRTTTTSTIDNRADLAYTNLKSNQSLSDYEVNKERTQLDVPHHNRASSETQSTNRYCVETSFDFDTPTMAAPTSMFGSSQRLSPASLSFAQPDSKQGSRVYLETSFE